MSEQRIEITLDGRKLMVEPGKTILEVAQSQGIDVPTLCHDRRLEPFASCWVCLVKVEKAKGFVPSCGTRVAPGMVISTSSTDVLAARKTAFELLLSNHYGDCKAPCSLSCPSNVDIQGYIGLLANGRTAEAAELIRRDNPMPAVIGRICPRPCESACRRRLVDEPLNINGLKRFVADAESETGGMPAGALPPRMGKRVAIVGAGPAGLSAAWYLSQEGVDVTLFEAMEKAGGMLRYGIPDYRLPSAVLDRAIAEMLSLGAVLKTGVALGKDISLVDIRSDFDAVILAIGAWKSRDLRIPGEEHKEVLSGIEFLRDVNSGKPAAVGARVAVIGGGNTALDAARCSLRLGAQNVTIYYRRTREEMPASDAEIEEALEEGIGIQFLAAPVSIHAEGERLKSLTLLKMELGEPDASGRKRPVPITGSEFSEPVDSVISAVGQYADTRLLESLPGLVDGRGSLIGDPETGSTGIQGVFAAGDLLSGADIAIRAVAGGKNAARSVLAAFEARPVVLPREFLSKKEDFREPSPDDYKDTLRAPRSRAHLRAPEARKKDFAEIESALSRDQAMAEAARCLACGCQDLKECRLKDYAGRYDAMAKRFLGEVAVHPIDDSHPFISRDPSKCILCGRCVRICLEVQGIGVFGYMYRGFASLVAPSFGTPFGSDTACNSCGQCVSACPVGALTEKLPGRKTVPLEETVEEGYCSLCSMCCALEYRRHGSMLTRVTERFEGPGNGKLCKKGRFGHGFLDHRTAGGPRGPDGAALTLDQAAEMARRMLAEARHPLMRISPLLCGEAIDAFVAAAAKMGIPVQAYGLERLDPGWARLVDLDGRADGLFQPGYLASPNTVCLMVGDIASSNNVAFTEVYRMRRQGLIEPWIVGHDDEVARRVASKVEPDLSKLKAILEIASKEGKTVEVLVNPEAIHERHGKRAEKAVLEALSAAGAAGNHRVTLLWNCRNSGYLLSQVHKATLAGKHDLYLDAGIDDGDASAKRIVWGRGNGEKTLSIPLPLELWIRGRSYPSGRESLRIGSIDEEGLAALTLLL